jgi:sugar lactone lactonase YvrE
VALFNYPTGVATDGAGNVLVADGDNRIIRTITPAGVVSTLAGTAGTVGHADGTGAAASFGYPQGLATDASGNAYVADSQGSTIRRVSPLGAVTTVVGLAGQQGFAPGSLPGLIPAPYAVAVSGSSLYLTSNYGVAVVRNLP